MSTMQTVVLVGHTAIALLIIILVLLQRGKGADAGAAFGAGASGTVFGARGSSSFFSRMTGILATAFFATSLGLAFMSSQRTEAPASLIESAPVDDAVEAPADESAADEMPSLEAIDEPSAEETADDMPSLENPESEENPQ